MKKILKVIPFILLLFALFGCEGTAEISTYEILEGVENLENRSYNGNDFIVLDDVDLPKTIGMYQIEWKSSDERYLTSDGKLNRPKNEDVSVKLTANVGQNSYSFYMYIEKAEDPDLSKIVLRGENVDYDPITELYTAYTNIDLPNKIGDFDVTWSSSNPIHITDEGVVTRTYFEGEEEITVILTATVGEFSRDIEVIVPEIENTIEFPTLEDLYNYNNYLIVENTLYLTVWQSLSFNRAIYGLDDITWIVSDDTYINTNGYIPNQPLENQSVKVILNSENQGVMYHVVLIGQKALNLSSMKIIDDNAIEINNSAEVFEFIGDVRLPQTYSGEEITWRSSDLEHLTNDGVIKREPFETINVDLVASVGGNVKVFYIRIPSIFQADEPIASLSGDTIVKIDDFNYETETDISLPQTINGYDIYWQSNNTAIIDHEGVVNRPMGEDVEVRMTANIEGVFSQVYTVKVKGQQHNFHYELLAYVSTEHNGLYRYVNTRDYTFVGMDLHESTMIASMNFSNGINTIFINYELTWIAHNLYQDIDTGYYFYFDEDGRYVEIYKEADGIYEVFILKNNALDSVDLSSAKIVEYLNTTNLNELSDFNSFLNRMTIELRDDMSASMFQISEDRVRYDEGNYIETEHFLIFEGENFKEVLLRDGDHYQYHAEAFSDLKTFIKTDEIIDVDLTANPSYMNLTEINFNGDSSVVSFVNDNFLTVSDHYLASLYLPFSSSLISYDFDGLDVLKNQEGIISYIDYLSQSNTNEVYLSYLLNDDLSKTLNIESIEGNFYPYIDGLAELSSINYGMNQNKYFARVNANEIDQYTDIFENLELGEYIYIQFDHVGEHIIHRFFDSNGKYLTDIIYEMNEDDLFDINSFEMIGVLSPLAGMKEAEIGYKYLDEGLESGDYYYKVSLPAGLYGFEYKHRITFYDELMNEVDFDLTVMNYGSYVELTENFTGYIKSSNWGNGHVLLGIHQLESVSDVEYQTVFNEDIVIQRDSIFDQSYMHYLVTTDTLFKISFNRIDQANDLIVIKRADGWMSSGNSQMIIYLEVKAGEYLDLSIYGSGVFYIDVIDEDIIETDEDNPLEIIGFETDVLINDYTNDFEYFTFTVDEGLVMPEVFKYSHRIFGDYAVDLNDYYSEITIRIWDESGNYVNGPLGPGTYKMLVAFYSGFSPFKVVLHQVKDIDKIIDLPFEETNYLNSFENDVVYTFNLEEKSFVEIETNTDQIFELIDLFRDEVLWRITGDYVITLEKGNYEIRLVDDVSYVGDVYFNIQNLGISDHLSFNDATIYQGSQYFNVEQDFDNELYRFKFEPTANIQYSDVSSDVYVLYDYMDQWYKLIDDTNVSLTKYPGSRTYMYVYVNNPNYNHIYITIDTE